MFQSKTFLALVFILLSFLAYQYMSTNQGAPSLVMQEESPQIPQPMTNPTISPGSGNSPAPNNLSSSDKQVPEQSFSPTTPQKPLVLKPPLRPEMVSFQKSPEFIDYLKKIDKSLQSTITNDSLRSKISQHLQNQLNKPVNLDNPEPKKPIQLSSFELSDLKANLQANKAIQKEDAQTFQLLLTLAVEADPSPQGKAETLGGSLQIEAESPEQIYYSLQNALTTAQVHALPPKLLAPYLEKSLSLQKDERSQQLLQETLNQLKNY